MNRALRELLVAVAILGGPGLCNRWAPAATDAEVQVRANSLRLAGAFSNDGFKIRDGHWVAGISSERPKVIQVNLCAGNQYWFIAAAGEGAKRIAVTVFDGSGAAVAAQPYENTAQAAAGFAPKVSGPYYIRVEELDGTPSTFCLIYSYK